MKVRDERSRGMEIFIVESLTKIKPTEPLRPSMQLEEIETDPIPPAVD
jgi:hypothetical protein